MGLFDFFKSNEDKIRSKIRKGFDDSVKHAIINSEFKDDPFLDVIVKGSLNMFYLLNAGVVRQAKCPTKHTAIT